MTNALGDALSEQQLGTQAQILWVLDEAKADDGPLSSPKLLLQAAVKGLNLPSSMTNQTRQGHRPFHEGAPP